MAQERTELLMGDSAVRHLTQLLTKNVNQKVFIDNFLPSNKPLKERWALGSYKNLQGLFERRTQTYVSLCGRHP